MKWYYDNMVSKEGTWSINLATNKKDDSGRIQIDECKYGELLYYLNEIDWRQ